jgi:O-Antigen ligase
VVKTVLGLAVAGGILLVVVGSNPTYRDHFEGIILGRAEKSSEGRFSLWQRGLETLRDSDSVILGIGPECFRDVDVLEKQLHNDLLAFAVERGLIGVLGLLLLAGFAVTRSMLLLQIGCRDSQVGISTVVFLGTFAAVLFASLTHQVFHAREIWCVLAVQEALLGRQLRVPALAIQKTPLQGHEYLGAAT